jgi:SnoaL-like domain
MATLEMIRRYFTAQATRDYAVAEPLRAPDWVCDWPQSGERVTSSAAMRAIIDQYPGGPWTSRERRITGSQDEYVLTPAGTVVQVQGSGDVWFAEWINDYPDGSEWFVIGIVELRDGRVRRETQYFAPAYEAPEWRQQWVERIAEG